MGDPAPGSRQHPTGGRLYLGAGRRGPVLAGREQGVLVLGPPRSGKTSSLVIPNVLAAPGPVLTTSTKPDVMAVTIEARAALGDCWVFDPSATLTVPPSASVLHWSPVHSSEPWDGALLIARAMVSAARPAVGLVEASHWTERAEALLAPLLHAAALDRLDIGDVLSWVNRHDGHEAQDILRGRTSGIARDEGRSGTAIALDLLGGILGTETRELSGIWSTASGVLAAYRSEGALASATGPKFDAERFVRSAATIYVCTDGRHQALVAPLVVGLIESVRAAAYRRAAEGVQTPGPLLLALDEVANIAPLPELPAIVAEGGGQGLVTLACLQDLSQARVRWGVAADGFVSLFGATVVLRGLGDVRTLDALSALGGDVDVPQLSVHRSRWRALSTSTTRSTRRQRRLAVDELSQGRPDQALVLGGGRRPAWIGLTPWYRTEPWRGVATPTRGRQPGPEVPGPEREPARLSQREPTRRQGRSRA